MRNDNSIPALVFAFIAICITLIGSAMTYDGERQKPSCQCTCDHNKEKDQNGKK